MSTPQLNRSEQISGLDQWWSTLKGYWGWGVPVKWGPMFRRGKHPGRAPAWWVTMHHGNRNTGSTFHGQNDWDADTATENLTINFPQLHCHAGHKILIYNKSVSKCVPTVCKKLYQVSLKISTLADVPAPSFRRHLFFFTCFLYALWKFKQ